MTKLLLSIRLKLTLTDFFEVHGSWKDQNSKEPADLTGVHTASSRTLWHLQAIIGGRLEVVWFFTATFAYWTFSHYDSHSQRYPKDSQSYLCHFPFAFQASPSEHQPRTMKLNGYPKCRSRRRTISWRCFQRNYWRLSLSRDIPKKSRKPNCLIQGVFSSGKSWTGWKLGVALAPDSDNLATCVSGSRGSCQRSVTDHADGELEKETSDVSSLSLTWLTNCHLWSWLKANLIQLSVNDRFI